MAQGQPFSSGMIDAVAMLATMIVTGLHMMTWVVFYFLNYLLDPQFIFDIRENGNQPFMDMLNLIWRFSRDMVNIVFAFALIGVAVVTVVMAKKDFIAEHWRKFVLAVILVNFSWLFPRLVFDVANIAAATVYSLPSMIAADNTCRTVLLHDYDGGNCVATGGNTNLQQCDCFYVQDIKMFVDPVNFPNNQGWECPLGGVLCYQRARLDFTAVAPHAAVLNGLVINHSRLQALASVPPRNPGNNPQNPTIQSSIGEIMLFILRELLVILFHVLLFFPLAALFVAFLVRIPFLWLTIAFMPFYFLGWVIPEKFTGGYTEKILDYFLKAAFLPAIVGIPLTVGFVMVNAGTNVTNNQFNTVAGNAFGGAQINLLPGVSTPWEILWILLSMGVVWVGVFTVLESMGKLGIGTAAIKSMGETIGGIAVKLPLSVPFIPGVGGGGKTGTVFQAADTLRGINAGIGRKDWDELLKSGPKGGEIERAAQKLAPDNSQNNTVLKDLTQELKNLAGRPNVTRDEIAEKINNHSRNTGFTVNANSLESDMRDFVAALNRNNRNDSIADDLNRSMSALFQRLPQTQAPAPAPAPAPAATPPPANP